MNSLYAALLDRIPAPITVVTATGAIMYRNRSFTQTFGSEADAWMRNATMKVAGERGWLHGFFDDTEMHVVETEFNNRTYRVEKILVDSLDPTSTALMLEDVTRQAEAEQARSDFTSMIVHDLRGPLSGIQATLDFVLQDEGNFGPMHQDLLKEAHFESDRMMNLINEILDFSKIRAGKFTIGDEPIRLAAMLRRVAVSLRAVATRNGVHLLSGHGADLPTITGSADKLTQALINLLSNSLKFTPAGGVIVVGAQALPDAEHPEAVLITVTDTGIGIPEEELAAVFEQYEQSSSVSVRGEAGTGLGLYIAREIVEAHGGTLDIASVQGYGTSMAIRLPVRRTAREPETDLQKTGGA